MKILVVYHTASTQRNTEKIAQTISEILKTKEFEVDCLYVDDVETTNVGNYDSIIAGSPTHAFRATPPITHFLDKLSKDQLTGKPAAAFDTQLQTRWSGNAANGIQKKLENLCCKIIMPPLVIYVEGKTEQVHLKDGEIEKAKKYAEDLANKLSQ